MVLGELSELLADGRLRPGDRVLEVSAGSTVRALAHHCRALGLQCDLFVPDTVPRDEIAALEALGATVHTGKREEGYALYEEFCERERPHRLEQLSDHALLRHYSPLGAAVNDDIGRDRTLAARSDRRNRPGPVRRERRAGRAECRPWHPRRRGRALRAAGRVQAIDVRPQAVLEPEARTDFGSVLTDRGRMQIGQSFSLVLSSIGRLLERRPVATLFRVGAENRL
jgi:hypothetical protein